MSWKYHYDEETDETEIIYKNETVGVIGGQIDSWIGGLPRGEAREIISEFVDDDKVVDLLYGFSKRDE